MERVINQLIFIAGAWNESGQTDKVLENQFKNYLQQLQTIAQTDQQGAMKILLQHLGAEPHERYAAG